jgi:hypothetical protein
MEVKLTKVINLLDRFASKPKMEVIYEKDFLSYDLKFESAPDYWCSIEDDMYYITFKDKTDGLVKCLTYKTAEKFVSKLNELLKFE